MDFRSTPCVFLGYSPLHHGYRCLDPTTDRVYIARHVRFNEENFPFTPSPTPLPIENEPPYFSSFPQPPPIPDTQNATSDPPTTTTSFQLAAAPVTPAAASFQPSNSPQTQPILAAPTPTFHP